MTDVVRLKPRYGWREWAGGWVALQATAPMSLEARELAAEETRKQVRAWGLSKPDRVGGGNADLAGKAL